ncbi:MAG: hypothetical protein OD811_05810 [Alphaproteobacteria bacterium]
MTDLRSSLSLRGLFLVGISLPLDSGGVASSAVLDGSSEYGFALQGEAMWLRSWLSLLGLSFTEREFRFTPVARALPVEVNSWASHEVLVGDSDLLRVREVREVRSADSANSDGDSDGDVSDLSWLFVPGDGLIYVSIGGEVVVRGDVSLMFGELPEDVREAAAHGYGSQLALTLTGSRSLSDVLLKRSESLVAALRARERRERLYGLRPLRPLGGDYVRAFSGGGSLSS